MNGTYRLDTGSVADWQITQRLGGNCVRIESPTLLEALRMADQAIWEAGRSATLLTPTDDTYEDSDPEC